jgi:hypothetical protein
MCGRITEIMEGGRRIKIAQILPQKEKMKGYMFWKKEGDTIRLDEQTQLKMNIIDYWLSEKNAKEYIIAVDDATGVFYNGLPQELSTQSMKPGDFVGIEMYSKCAMQDVIYSNLIRVTKQKQ